MRVPCLLALLALASAQSAGAQQQAAPPEPPTSAASPAPAATSSQPAAPDATQFQPAASPLVDPAAPQSQSPAPPPQGPYGYPTQAPVYPPAPQVQPYAPYTPYGVYAQPSGYPAAPAYGQEPLERGAREHDGFFLRMKAGLGAGGVRYRERFDGQRNARVKTRGLAGMFDFAVGGALSENWILHGNLSVAFMNAHKKIDGVEVANYDDLSSAAILVGGGATYYFMPTNFYLTLVVGTSALSEDRYYDGFANDADYYGYAGDTVQSGPGFGTTLSVGKEWWVGRSAQWGLGIDLTGGFYLAPVENSPVTSNMIADVVTVSFTATYN